MIQLLNKHSAQSNVMSFEEILLLQAFLLFCRLLITFDLKSLRLSLFMIYL